MSLSSILRMGASGLKVSQASLRTVSENISNVNTPGYVRKIVDQQASVVGATGYGVEIGGVRRAADLYLQRTSLEATSEAGRADAVAGFLDRAQVMFGDPSNDTSFFKKLDDVFSAFATAAEDPTSNLRRTAAVQEVTRFFDDAALISGELTSLRQETDGRLAAAADQVNGLLDEITKLNKEISAAVIRGRDATGAENAQSKLIDELSGLLDIKVTPKAHGGVVLRAGDGTELAGAAEGSARLVFDRFGGAGLLNIVPFGGKAQAFAAGLEGGEIKGLVELRQTVSATACTHDRAPITPFDNPSLYSANQPVVGRTDYVMDVGTGGGGITGSERERLVRWFETLRLSYGDRVFIDDGGSYGDAASRQDVAALAAEYGLLLSEGAPVTPGVVQPGSVRVIVSRTYATVPGCPLWADEPLNAPERTATNYGCATNSNLAAMIADPNDLVLGQSDTEGTRASEAKKSVEIFNNRVPSGFKLKSAGGK